jgi:NAD-dependent deacetylase sirtuin 4
MTITIQHEHPESLDSLVALLRGRRVAVLAGAGCSTDSGIPDYRGPEGSLRGRNPIQYMEFLGSEEARARYWSRSFVGWPRMERAIPNAAHECLARLEMAGVVTGIITQNVDGLHHKAGSGRVVELHGSLAWVRCLDCGARVPRSDFQDRIRDANVRWAARMEGIGTGGGIGVAASLGVQAAPDGDAEVPVSALEGFRVPACDSCGGVVKPDVVFFGENVPSSVVSDAWRIYEDSNAILVVGSSLTVYSGRRFLYRAVKEDVPIGVVNLGPTRADEMAAARVDGRLGQVLPRLVTALARPGAELVCPVQSRRGVVEAR